MTRRTVCALEYDRITAAFSAEAERLASVMLGLKAADWARPTACPPWTVSELLAHVVTILARIPAMLATSAPPRADVGVVDYYRPDDRFSAKTNAERIDLARQRAYSARGGHGLAIEFDDTWRNVLQACLQEPRDRVVRTRHGDAMLLSDFLVTRVVELGIHGLDLAAALDHPPWLTPEASSLLIDLLLGGQNDYTLDDLGWDEITFLRKATGREPLTADENEEVRTQGIRWLTLG